MLISNFSDIGPDEVTRDLEEIARSVGLTKMSDVLDLILTQTKNDRQRVSLVVTEENALTSLRLLIAMATISHISAKYEHFTLPTDNPSLGLDFHRRHSIESYEKSRDNNLRQAKYLWEKYRSSHSQN